MFGSLPSMIAQAGAIELRSFLLPAAVLLIVFVLMRRAAKVRRRGKASDPSPAGFGRLAAAKSAPPEANAWMVELNDLARDTVAQIDTKVSVLRRLLLLAEEQEKRLRHLLDQVETNGDNEGQLPELPQASAPQPPLTARDARISALSQAGYSDVYISNQVQATLPEVRQVLSNLAALHAQPPVT